MLLVNALYYVDILALKNVVSNALVSNVLLKLKRL